YFLSPSTLSMLLLECIIEVPKEPKRNRNKKEKQPRKHEKALKGMAAAVFEDRPYVDVVHLFF
ncbi:MAG: hypothetical protein V1758_06505, partial [Pseudomonadota bacterium]